MNNGEDWHIRPCCVKELAALYEVKPRTIRIWLEPFKEIIGKKRGRYYNIKQVQLIIEKLGEPKIF